MTRTSTDTYDRDLADAVALYDQRVETQPERDTYPGGEYAKDRDDRLNNVWCEGITVEEWVARAIRGF